MRNRLLALTFVGLFVVSVGALNASAVSATPFTYYAYEEVGPPSLLADPSQGVEFITPGCSPSPTHCTIYKFWDRWDLAPTGTETDTTNVLGYVDVRGFDGFQMNWGTFSLGLSAGGTVWNGSFVGTFKGPNSGTGVFALRGSDGSRMTGAIVFLDDGLMKLTGQLQ